ncbi:MAG: 50S ribosomal protein L24 [Candidatus Nanohaloarchaea archaeon]
MTQRTEDWSSDWNSSTNPSKQRKYRQNAPLHVKDRLVSANLSNELREELGTRNIRVRTGDRAKVVRGDDRGSEGIVNSIDREEEVVYIDGIERERADGSKQQKALRPSNLQLVALNVENTDRIEKYDVEDIASIEVDEEELEEALEEDEEEEMMEQMQGGESGAHEEYEEEEEVEDKAEESRDVEEADEDVDEETETEPRTSVDYEDIVSGTISDAKDQLAEMEDVDYEEVLEAEKSNKNRTTFIDWLENQVEDKE